jgi:hypothetical protein
VARIAGVSHQHPAFLFLFHKINVINVSVAANWGFIIFAFRTVRKPNLKRPQMSVTIEKKKTLINNQGQELGLGTSVPPPPQAAFQSLSGISLRFTFLNRARKSSLK